MIDQRYTRSRMPWHSLFCALQIELPSRPPSEWRRLAETASLSIGFNPVLDCADQFDGLVDLDPDFRQAIGQIGLDRMRNQLEWRHQTHQLLAAYEEALR